MYNTTELTEPMFCYLDTPEGDRVYYLLTSRLEINGSYYYRGFQTDSEGRIIDTSVLWGVAHFNRCVGAGIAGRLRAVA